MKRIETIMRRSELGRFYQCAGKLGIFGFDLSEDHAALKIDFAVRDTEAKETVHAVLDQVHPDSIAIFKLDNEPASESSAVTFFGAARTIETRGMR